MDSSTSNYTSYKFESSTTTISKHGSGNKENVASYCVATLIENANPNNTSLVLANLNNTVNTIDTSFDLDKVKYDAYEKSIQKLANENKALRKRVKNLTELARSKEDQLLNAFNDACEDKRKNEEISQQEHNQQLQSYYECFLQIEKVILGNFFFFFFYFFRTISTKKRIKKGK